MTELVVTRGIPASGKTTWARAWVDEDPAARVRVSRDDLRAQLFGAVDARYAAYFADPALGDRERAVTRAEDALVQGMLRAGRSVVVDATHVKSSYVRRWRDLAAKFGAEFRAEVLDPGLDECLARDARRQWPVGERVVRDMHQRLRSSLRAEELEGGAAEVAPPPEDRVYEPAAGLPFAWIFDVDGTLALMNGRGPYDTGRYHEDLPCEPVVALANALHAWGHAVVVMSGRDEEFRPQTEEWLTEHGVPWEALHMRPRGDRRNDRVVKAELFWEHVAPRWHVLGSVDDRDRVVEGWRAMGLTCLQAAPGDF